MIPSEGAFVLMVVFFVSVWMVFPSEATVE